MNIRLTAFFILILFLTTFSGCQVIEDIFKAGAWTGIIGVLIVMAIIVLIFRATKK